MNPFYVQPGNNFGQGLMGLAQQVDRFGAIQRQKESEAKQQEYIAQGKSALGEAMKSGDLTKIRDVMVQYPELQKQAEAAFGFTNEQTRRIAADTYRQALSDPDRALEYMDQGIRQVAAAGGSPDNMIQDYAMLKVAPENALKSMRAGYAALANEQEYNALFGDSGTASALRQQEIDLRRQALEQSGQQFSESTALRREQMAQEERALQLQDKRLQLLTDPERQGELASSRSAGAATGKKGAERAAQYEDWAAFKGSLSSVYPDIGAILESAPESSMSKVVSTLGSKILGGNNLNEAQAEIEQLGAILLQQVPFPPGAQSEAEQKARAMTLGRLEDPNISPDKKLEMINRFLQINEQKFEALKGKADESSLDDLVNKYAD